MTFDNTGTNFLVATADVVYNVDKSQWAYAVNISMPANVSTARETSFTVTTYVNGAPVVKKYRLIQKAI